MTNLPPRPGYRNKFSLPELTLFGKRRETGEKLEVGLLDKSSPICPGENFTKRDLTRRGAMPLVPL